MERLDVGDLTPRVFGFTYNKTEWRLREAPEKTALAYKGQYASSGRMGPGVLEYKESVAEIERTLLLGCLFEVYSTREGERERPVTVEQLKAMPYRLTHKLFIKARDISELQELPDKIEDLDEIIGKLQTRREQLAAEEAIARDNNGVLDSTDPQGLDPLKNGPSATRATSG